MIIVLVSYRIPEARLRAHFAWNEDGYRAAKVGVLAVVDAATFARVRGGGWLPPYAAALEYPGELCPFSLARTANFGLRRAVAAGGVAVKTDVDCYFTSDLLARCALATPGQGVAPVYRMASSIEEARAGRGQTWSASRGTVALAAADWQRLCGFNEDMTGYGVEDGDLWDRALAAGVKFDRPASGLYHIAHAPPLPMAPLGRRAYYWNRDAGNPANHEANSRLRGRPWVNPQWGCAPNPA